MGGYHKKSHHHKQCESSSDSSNSQFCSTSNDCQSSCTEQVFVDCYRGQCRPRKSCSSSTGRSCTPGIYKLRALLTPMKNLKDLQTECPEMTINIRRKNKIVHFQWNGFKGQIGANGTSYVYLNQTISGLPHIPLQFPIRIKYNDEVRLTYLEIDPFSTEQIRFYLRLDGTSSNVEANDTLTVYGSTVSWIAEC